jgi:hypothetical protein
VLRLDVHLVKFLDDFRAASDDGDDQGEFYGLLEQVYQYRGAGSAEIIKELYKMYIKPQHVAILPIKQ